MVWEIQKNKSGGLSGLLAAEAANFGFTCKDTQRNGNCLFEAVLDQLGDISLSLQYSIEKFKSESSTAFD